jgi:shikimate kinase
LTLLEPVYKNLALTGFMAAGKTVVSRRLARKLEWRFIDLDQVIETNQGLPIQAIFSQQGEGSFRAAEKHALEQVLEQEGQVIALGGGAVLDPENLHLLKERGLLIWLKVSPKVVLQRIKRKNNRPLLQGADPLKRIEELAAQRENVYAEAGITVDTDDKPVDRVVDEILQLLNEYPSRNQ